MIKVSIVKVRNMRNSKLKGEFPCAFSFNDARRGNSYHIRIGTQAERMGKLVISTAPHNYRNSMFIVTVEERQGISFVTTMEVI